MQKLRPLDKFALKWLSLLAVLEIIGLLLLSMHFSAHAAALPYPKASGPCASGTYESGGYCVPMTDKSPQALPKLPGKQCPSNFSSGASSCTEMSKPRH